VTNLFQRLGDIENVSLIEAHYAIARLHILERLQRPAHEAELRQPLIAIHLDRVAGQKGQVRDQLQRRPVPAQVNLLGPQAQEGPCPRPAPLLVADQLDLIDHRHLIAPLQIHHLHGAADMLGGLRAGARVPPLLARHQVTLGVKLIGLGKDLWLLK